MATTAFTVQPSFLGTLAPSQPLHRAPTALSRVSGLLRHDSSFETYSAVLSKLASGGLHQCSRSKKAFSGSPEEQKWRAHRKLQLRRRVGARAEAETESASETSERETKGDQGAEKAKGVALDKEVSKVVRKTAATFAPRASTKSKNPATQGTVLYTVFEVQAWVSIVAGFLLSYNLIFPSDRPDIARLLGMWSVWMLAVPSLRARDCSAAEKEALNYLFVLIPVINVLIPVFWKSFAAVFTADCVAMVAMYAWKMEWFAKDDATST